MADDIRNDDSARDPTSGATPRRTFLQATIAGAAATGLLGLGCGDDSTEATAGSGGGSSNNGPSATSTSGTAASGSGEATSTSTASGSAGNGGAGQGGSGQGGGGGAGPTTSSNGSGGGGGGGTPTCEETEDDIEGPFYTAGAPFVDGALPGLDGLGGGVYLRLSGVVRSASDCAPIDGAILDLWQADDEGVYDNQGFTLRGRVRADEEGRYEIDTIIPGRYLNGAQFRPAHIHVKVSAPGHALLTTQLYFPDDPFNEVDSFFDERLLIAITPGEGLDFGVFDFSIVQNG